MAIIRIENIEFFSHHGCFAEEQIIGNKFTVDIVLETDTAQAEITDDLAKTVNYQEVYNIALRQMEKPSKLLEHVARRIADEIVTDHPQIMSLRVKVSKYNPPLGGKVDKVSVEISVP